MYTTGTAANYLELLELLVNAATIPHTIENLAYDAGNTGDGEIGTPVVVDDAPNETWTLVCTGAGPSATFSVTGSVSGAQAIATSGVAYDNGIVAFTIADGTTAWAVDDEITFDIEGIGEEAWEVLQNTTSGFTTDGYVILKGFGMNGDEEIFVGIKAYHSDSLLYWNWSLQGYTGYNALMGFATQAGAIPTNNPNVGFSVDTLDYWIAVNGQRIVFIVKSDTIFENGYLGLGFPTVTPDKIAYALIVGGSLYGEGLRYSDTTTKHSAYWNCYHTAPTLYMLIGLEWKTFGQSDPDTGMSSFPPTGYTEGGAVCPYANDTGAGNRDITDVMFYKLGKNIDGTANLLAMSLFRFGTYKGSFGEFDGIYAVSGAGNVTTEDVITQGADEFIVSQNCFKSGFNHLMALRKE